MILKLIRRSFIQLPENRDQNWQSHMMAPAPLYINLDTCIVYFGAWDTHGISSIFSMNLNLSNFEASDFKFQMERGIPGSFDENGVFPGAIFNYQGKNYLSYTGFQLGFQIPHYNFAGICEINSDNQIIRMRDFPLLDRTSEGLFVRSGYTYLNYKGMQLSAYAAGSSFENISGKLRPNYDIYLQRKSPFEMEDFGVKIIECQANEHGLGRPYISCYKEKLLIFHTRRMKNFKYKVGLAVSDDSGETWTRMDHLLDEIQSFYPEVDDEMQYFPAPLIVKNSLYLFYNGNNFGKSGIGVAEFQLL